MITDLDFTVSMGFLAEMLPMQRAFTQEALAMAWETLPGAAKINLTPASLAFAVKQRLLDPQPLKDVALHISLLRYVFPVDRTTKRERGEEVIADRVIVENGPRSDLAERMADPDRFHDPAPARQEYQAARRLPEGNYHHPNQMVQAERCRHLEVIAIQLEAAIAQGEDDRRWTDAQLAQGHWWFKQALSGFWNLKADKGGIAKAWISRNPGIARQMLQQVREVEQIEAVEHTENPVDAFLAGAW